jgi:hypothetical protein
MLYFNASNNLIDGGVPEGLGNLEMFRSPANSTDPFDMYVTTARTTASVHVSTFCFSNTVLRCTEPTDSQSHLSALPEQQGST